MWTPLVAGSTYKVYADGRNVTLGVGIIGKPKQQARLSNTRITDEEELEEVVVSRGGLPISIA